MSDTTETGEVKIVSSTGTIQYTDKWLPLHDLEIDRRVQRTKPKPVMVEKLAKEWDENLAGVVYVSHRRDGSYVVLDGDHRVLAKRRLTDGAGEILCRVFEGLSTAEEGYIFVGVNPGNQPSVIDKYRVGVFTGDEQTVRIDRIVHSRGYIVDGQGGNGHINSVKALRDLDDLSLKMGAEPHLLDYTLNLIGRAWGNDRYGLQNAIIVGLGRFIAEYGDRANHDTLLQAMRTDAPQSWLTRAQGLAAMKRKRKSMAFAELLVEAYNGVVRAEKNKLRSWPHKR